MVQPAYEAWAEILRYPGEGRSARLHEWVAEVAGGDPVAGGALAGLLAFAAEHDEGELEEAFVRSFENNSERALELGWHLHGENYARGSFMVRLRQLMREHGIEETCELPDHASHVLRLIARAKPELADALAQQVVLPALNKIRAGFTDTANPYCAVMHALDQFVRQQHRQEEARG